MRIKYIEIHKKSQATNSGILNIDPLSGFSRMNEWLTTKFLLSVPSRVFGSFRIAPACYTMAGIHKPVLKTTLNFRFQKRATHRVVSGVR